jgi:tetratricopeptide (TPR) repeat protein
MVQKNLFKSRFDRWASAVVLLSVVVVAALLLAKYSPGLWSAAKHHQVTTDTTLSVAAKNSPSSRSQKPAVKPAVVSESQKRQQKALSLYDQGLKLYYDRQFYPALALFNQALTIEPDCYQALNGKGATYAFLGRYNEGIALINQAINLKPDFFYAHFNLGLANELAGRWDAAIAAYHSALKLDPKSAWSYYGIASIYGRHGNVEQTVAYLKQAIALEADVKDFAKKEKDFTNVKNDPRFQALLK